MLAAHRTDAVVCDRCGVTLPGRTGALPRDARAAVLHDHYETALCAAGTEARRAGERGLVRPLFFETKLNHALHREPDHINDVRVRYMRENGVTVESFNTKLNRDDTTRGFVVVAEPWAPLWAVALVWGGAEPAVLARALRRGAGEAAYRGAAETLVRLMLGPATIDSTVDLRAALRDLAEAL